MGSELRRDPSEPSSSTSNRRPSNTTQNDAMDYLKAVKEEFAENSQSYQNFLQIMKEFKSATIKTEEVVRRVKELFRWHPELILGFNQFLPNDYKISLPDTSSNVDFSQAMSYVTKIKERFLEETEVYTAFLAILYSYKKSERPTHDVIREVQHLFKNHPDLIEEFYQFLPVDTSRFATVNLRPGSASQPINIEKGNNSNSRPEMEQNNSEPEQHGSQSTSDPDSTHQDLNDVKGDEMRGFLAKLKDRLEPEAYEDLLKCFFSFSEGALIADDVNLLVHDVLSDHPDLLSEFNQIISHRENLVNESVKIENNNNNNNNSNNNNSNSNNTSNEEGGEEREREGGRRERQSRKSKTPPLLQSSTRYNMTKPVSELDLSNCPQCTPSYRLLPKNQMVPPSSHRSELEKSVLNDKWVSVTSGSEDYSFKHMRRNQYEESLFRCEDDRFEMDMLVESTKSTIERVERLMKKLHRGKINAHENFLDFFNLMNVRCIEKIYGDHGMDVMDVIKKNADVALPVVLQRLNQKLHEWMSCRNDFNKVWAEVYAKNHHKSLDHRSFIFKQDDMKNLSSKALQAEIKEKHEINLKDDALLIAIGAKPRNSTSHPDLEFKFPDCEIQEDMYQILKFSCKEVFPAAADLARRALRVYAGFVEPFLGAVDRVRGEIGEGGRRGGRIVSVGGSGVLAVDEGSGTGSPGRADVAGGSPAKPGETIEAVKEELSRQEEEEREEGEISPDREEGENSPNSSSEHSGSGENEERENQEEMEEGENEEEMEEGENESEQEEQEGEIDHQEKLESEGEAETEEITDSPLSSGGTCLGTVRPVSVRTGSGNRGNGSEFERVFYADGCFYVLFRLYQVLYERMLSAKTNAKETERKWIASKGTNPGDLYARFKSALYNLLDGSSDSGKYEDECRAAVGGTETYLLFTLDQLIFKICKQLQTIETEETSKKLLELYKYERSRGPGPMSDSAYYHNALVVLHDETIYRLAFGEKAGKLSIQLMDQLHKSAELTAVAIDPIFGEYLYNEYLSNKSTEKEIQGVFLRRNKRKQEFDDENSPNCKALIGIKVSNGLECKMTCSRSKVAYVLDTEDYFYREGKRGRINEDQTVKIRTLKSHKFRVFLSRRLDQMK